MREYSISVAMATYNGEKYIMEQLESILPQLSQNDEIVISDDGSTDKTIDIIKKIDDKRIKVIKGPRRGVKQNFANSISNCKGKYIFLSDQDDIWMPNKVEEVLKCFEETGAMCVIHDCDVVNGDNTEILIDSFFNYRGSKSGIFHNIVKNGYIGCCMAINIDAREYILPISNKVEMHDQWVGIICEKHGKSIFLNKKLIHYRRHNENTSSMRHYTILK